MATTRTILIDASTRHAVFVQRFAGSQIKEIATFLEKTKAVVKAELKKKSISKASKARQQKILKDIDDQLKLIYAQLSNKLKDNMKEFAEYEADFSARMFTNATNVDFDTPSNNLITAAVFTKPLLLTDDALDIESALRQLSKKKRAQMIKTIKEGVLLGKTSQEIISDTALIADTLQRRNVSTLVRTVTNHVSTAAREATIDQNKDVLKGVEWVSTLDSGTTPTCQTLDGKVFKRDKGPRPPIHWGCRSAIIPRVKDEYSVRDQFKSERPAVGSEGAETVDGRATYNSWLKKQPKAFQEEVLGVTKAKLFREGGLDVGAFVDRNYQPLTLKQLKRKEPLAFERAGLK